MRKKTIETIQKIEQLSQMQFCAQDYLDAGHSIYAAYDLDELGGIMFHGTYTDYNTLPRYLGELNGTHLETIAAALLENGAITQDEHDEALKYYG